MTNHPARAKITCAIDQDSQITINLHIIYCWGHNWLARLNDCKLVTFRPCNYSHRQLIHGATLQLNPPMPDLAASQRLSLTNSRWVGLWLACSCDTARRQRVQRFHFWCRWKPNFDILIGTTLCRANVEKTSSYIEEHNFSGEHFEFNLRFSGFTCPLC